MRGDLEWVSVAGLVRAAGARFATREALIDGDVRMSFADLSDAVGRAARATVAAGVAKGDRVSIWAPNSHEWAIAALGAVSAGAVLVPVNTRFKGPEAGYVLAKSGARILFTVEGFLGNDYVGMLAGEDLPALERIVVLRGPATTGTEPWADFLAAGDSVTPDVADARIADLGPDDVSDITFTSGTTGRPKGAMITHGQTLRVFEQWGAIVGLAEGDRYLVVNPFFHTFGYKAGVIASLMQGATLIPHATFDVPRVLATIEAEHVGVLPGPPTLYQSLLDHPDRGKFDLSSLRLAVTGAAVVPVELIRRMRDELTFRTIVTAYGLTESSGMATACRPDDDPETIASTSGRAIDGTEVQVVDDAGAEVRRGDPGEVVVRGYNVMRGYFEDPEETAAAIDGEGWLHTGDVGVMDERGYLRITDRKKDMFIVGGFNAYPAEIENVLLAHPHISQAAVVGVPDERLGEVGMAFLVARPGCVPDPDEIVAWCRERMANFKVPRRVEVVDNLPLNASGKVLKYELRDRAAQA